MLPATKLQQLIKWRWTTYFQGEMLISRLCNSAQSAFVRFYI